jgi:hypothetical protein
VSDDLRAFVDAALSPKEQSRVISDVAREALRDAEQKNARALGRTPEHTTTVDGRKEAALESVKPDGMIVFEFQIITDALVWIAEQLKTHSPRRTGAFAASHILLADGKEVDPKIAPSAQEYVFMSMLPYAGPLERGHSKQAPNGIYEVVAALADRRFHNQARVQFTYRMMPGLMVRGRKAQKAVRQPAIIVVP